MNYENYENLSEIDVFDLIVKENIYLAIRFDEEQEKIEEKKKEKERIAGRERRMQLAEDFFFKQLWLIKIAFNAFDLYYKVRKNLEFFDYIFDE